MRTALLALLLVAACRCDDSPPPIRRAEAPKPRKDEQLLAKIPRPEGTPFEATVLATVLPATLGEAAAEGDVYTETTPLGDAGKLPLARRVYAQGGTRITVQLTDMQHAPVMRQMMLDAKKQAEKMKSPSWAPATVHGHEAVLQYLPTQGAAIANVTATDRLFVNVRVEPAGNAEAALPWAEKVAYEPITKLAPPQTPPAAPSP
jgi:hypothetical protein